jgi:hypothetical protein
MIICRPSSVTIVVYCALCAKFEFVHLKTPCCREYHLCSGVCNRYIRECHRRCNDCNERQKYIDDYNN